jgi:hypothetical protein
MYKAIAALLLIGSSYNLPAKGGGGAATSINFGTATLTGNVPTGNGGTGNANGVALPFFGSPVTIAGSTTVSQGAATQITAPYTIVTGSGGNTVAKLPVSPIVGQMYLIEVSGGETQLVLYPGSGGQIDENGTNAFALFNTMSLSTINNARIFLVPETATQWRYVGQAADYATSVNNDTPGQRHFGQNDFHGGVNILHNALTIGSLGQLLDAGGSAAVTAAGSSIGTCTQLVGGMNFITGGAGGTGTCLPASAFGERLSVHNGSGNAQVVFPPNSSSQINALGNGASMALPNVSRLECVVKSATQFYCSTISDL